MIRSDDQDRARDMGVCAAIAGRTRDDNPFPKDSSAHEKWEMALLATKSSNIAVEHRDR